MTQTSNVLNGISPLSQSAGVVNLATGSYVGDHASGDGSGAYSVAVSIGFTPRYVRLQNMTTGDMYEWMEGMAATKTLFTNHTGPAVTIDTNSVIVTNSTIVTATEVAPEGAPGASGAGEGTQGTVTLSYDNPALGTAQLVFNSTASASGAPVNANGVLYVWLAQG